MAAAATIGYCASEHDALKFWAAHDQRTAPPQVEIPKGFPSHIASTFAWDCSKILSKQSEWVLEINEDEAKQLEIALGKLEQGKVKPESISPETFPIPEALRSRLREISDILYHGVGLVLLKGLDSSRYTEDENAKLFAGISCHIAPQRGFLDWKREMVLGHMINARKAAMDGRQKTPGFTNSSLVRPGFFPIFSLLFSSYPHFTLSPYMSASN